MSNNKREILGASDSVKNMISLIKRVAPAKTNILIIGESGTGKELVARMIHDHSPMKDRAFIPVNCGAIPETLIESEMFGHKRGSFTGAIADKPGLFEAASGGTLFLDEIGELPLSMQVKMLRALQERVIRRVGDNHDIKVDVRIIAATNRDLEAAVKKGTFREDLYYRLNVILIKTPSLRERTGDVRILAEAFLKKCLEKYSKILTGFDSEAMLAIENYTWPGNVRELENVIERAVTLENTDRVSLGVLSQQIQDAWAKVRSGESSVKIGSVASTTNVNTENVDQSYFIQIIAPQFQKGPVQLDQILEEIEKKYLIAALDASGGIKKKAAELLGITFRSIRYRLKKNGMECE